MRIVVLVLVVACTRASSDAPPKPDLRMSPKAPACTSPTAPQFVPLSEKATAIDPRR
ncbi:MAG: hypothetical protein ABI867_22500 [Kofleriaceae bacterium]